MPPEQVLESNLPGARVQQVASALAAVGMTDELGLSEEAKGIEVKVRSRAELSTYVRSMRAVLIGLQQGAEAASTP